jgi:hypothetical protein
VVDLGLRQSARRFYLPDQVVGAKFGALLVVTNHRCLIFKISYTKEENGFPWRVNEV